MKRKVCSERGAKRMRAQLGMKRVLQKVVCLLLSAVMLAGGVSFASADAGAGQRRSCAKAHGSDLYRGDDGQRCGYVIFFIYAGAGGSAAAAEASYDGTSVPGL